ncbi:MAG: DUF2569 domain-containing protein [candidate division Zixibacteria bacterium]|nr:DUF2569 domain-containing protein [candidate division Zixibacteria bacterium]
MTNSTGEPKGLKGWLILPAIGLIVAPLRLAINLLKDFWPIFRDGYWPVLTTPGTETYHPLWQPLLTFEIVGNTIFILANLALLFFFFTKHWRFPTLYITILALNVVFVTSDFFMGSAIPAVAASHDPQPAREMARTLGAAAIWIPYFLRSKRVKNTFVKPGAASPLQPTAGMSQYTPAVPTGV